MDIGRDNTFGCPFPPFSISLMFIFVLSTDIDMMGAKREPARGVPANIHCIKKNCSTYKINLTIIIG